MVQAEAEEEEDEEPHVSTSSFPTLLGIGRRERGRLSSSTSKDSGDVSAVRRQIEMKMIGSSSTRSGRYNIHQDYGDSRTTAAAASDEDEDEETRDRSWATTTWPRTRRRAATSRLGWTTGTTALISPVGAAAT